MVFSGQVEASRRSIIYRAGEGLHFLLRGREIVGLYVEPTPLLHFYMIYFGGKMIEEVYNAKIASVYSIGYALTRWRVQQGTGSCG
jgi:hypothetical protein